MKSTGIVRRIDDLGRVVIPKEIRKQMKIKEGDPLEIFTDKGMVCFQRYDPVDESKWALAAKAVGHILEDGFRLADQSGIETARERTVPNIEECEFCIIDNDYGEIGYLYVPAGRYNNLYIDMAIDVAREILID